MQASTRKNISKFVCKQIYKEWNNHMFIHTPLPHFLFLSFLPTPWIEVFKLVIISFN